MTIRWNLTVTEERSPQPYKRFTPRELGEAIRDALAKTKVTKIKKGKRR